MELNKSRNINVKDAWISFKEDWFLDDISINLDVIVKDVTKNIKREAQNITENNNPWAYFLVYLFPILWLISCFTGGWFILAVPFFITVILPLIEFFDTAERVNPADEDYESLQSDNRYNWALWIWPPVQIAMLIVGCLIISLFQPSIFYILGLSLATGLISGPIGFNIAHELIHRRDDYNRTFGQIILLACMYPHFYIEHLWGHHMNIGLRRDTGTSRRGETLYQYLPRSIKDSYIDAWRISYRFKKIHIMLLYHIAVAFYIWLVFSLSALTSAFTAVSNYQIIYSGLCSTFFVMLQSVIAALFLETINYIEHYGLSRQKGEKITIHHSWNTDKVITNYFSFRIQRHSDHHTDSKRKYPNLRDFPEAPRLPTGYAGCVLLATIPPLWKWIMDPRLEKALQKRIDATKREQ